MGNLDNRFLVITIIENYKEMTIIGILPLQFPKTIVNEVIQRKYFGTALSRYIKIYTLSSREAIYCVSSLKK